MPVFPRRPTYAPRRYAPRRYVPRAYAKPVYRRNYGTVGPYRRRF